MPRPAILIVDFVNGFADPDQFRGGNIREAIENTSFLLAEARAFGMPVAFSRVVYAAKWQRTVNVLLQSVTSPENRWHPSLRSHEHDKNW